MKLYKKLIFVTMILGIVSTVLAATAPDVSNINVIDITNNSAKITFNVDQIDARTIVLYDTRNPGSNRQDHLSEKSGWNNDTGLTRSIPLSGLTSNKRYYYSILSVNGTEQNKSSYSSIDHFNTNKTVISAPTQNITNNTAPEISNINVTDIGNTSANITFKLNQTDAEAIIHYGTSTAMSSRSVQNNGPGFIRTIQLSGLMKDRKYFFSVYANNKSDSTLSTHSATLNFTTNSSISTPSTTPTSSGDNKSSLSGTGNRIWDGSKGMDTNYSWNSFSFAGFYYDLDNNLSTEFLDIRDIKRTISEGNVLYTTSPIEVNFDYSGFGKYQVIGFMADKYFAGYTTNSTLIKEDKNVIENGQLQKILFDDENKRVISQGGTLTLKEGYVLKFKEVDIGAGKGQIWVVLEKDGTEVDDSIVAGGDTYIYSKKVGSEDNLPIILVHFDSVFRGKELNAAFVKGLFQISESITSIKNGDEYGKMEVDELSKEKIVMRNKENIDLSRGNKINLMGDLKIIVADSDTLRFALSVERSGTFEVRGTIYPITTQWTPMNFGLNVGDTNIGFYYDLDEDIGIESLKVQRSGSSISDGNLEYSTSPQEVSFVYKNFGKYDVIGFMADKYFAGYTDNTTPPNPSTSIGIKSVISQGQLHRVLIDDEDKRTISVGATFSLKEGYVLKAKDIDMSARTMLLSLLKDGVEVDEGTPLSSGQTYVYTKKVGTIDDLPLVMVRFDSVFSGQEIQAAFLKGVFQISEKATSVKVGDSYGNMEVTNVGDGGITMENQNSIDLSPGSTTDVMGNIKFKVADSGEVRFYPFVTVSPEMIGNQLVVSSPSKATAGDTIRINVTAGVNVIDGATITITPDIGPINNTNKDGIVNFTFPTSSKGKYNITATKVGYQQGNKTIEIEKYIENRLSIDIPTTADQNDTISINVTFNGTGIEGATVNFDNMTIGTTDKNGKLNYLLESSGIHSISASKNGYIAAARDIDIRPPYSDFKGIDIIITPKLINQNEDVNIKSNITNAGTKADTKYVELLVNGSMVNNKSITIGPKETKQINFTYRANSPEGNYTVEILGQKELLEVKKSPINIMLILAIIIVIGAIVIYIVTEKDELTGLINKYKK